MICPFCQHSFSLTWRRYWSAPLAKHACPRCGRKSKLSTGLIYWGVYVPLLIAAPFAIIFIALLAYGFAFPNNLEENIVSFLCGPWLLIAWLGACALLFPIDRMVDARFRRLKAPTDEERAV